MEIELPPWDKKSKGGDNLVFQSKEYRGCLNKKRSMLVEATPNFMPGFWDALIELEVLTARDRTRIQVKWDPLLIRKEKNVVNLL